MASSVEEFTNRLIDPLKSDINLGLRGRFERCFDDVMENAIAFEQKKVRTKARFFKLYSTKYFTARWCRICWVSESFVLGSLIISFDLLCYLFTQNSSIVFFQGFFKVDLLIPGSSLERIHHNQTCRSNLRQKVAGFCSDSGSDQVLGCEPPAFEYDYGKLASTLLRLIVIGSSPLGNVMIMIMMISIIAPAGISPRRQNPEEALWLVVRAYIKGKYLQLKYTVRLCQKNSRFAWTGAAWHRWVMMTFLFFAPASKRWLGWRKTENIEETA